MSSGIEHDKNYRIGYDAKRLFNNFTGLGNYSRTLVHNLHAQFPDNQYFLYTPKIADKPVVAPFLSEKDYTTLIPDIPLKALWRSYTMVGQMQRDRLDIYHGLSHELPFGIPKSIKTVVTIHDLIFKRYPNTYPWFDRQIYDFKFRRACHTADAIIAISESTKRDIVHYYGISPERIKVVYQTCSPQYFLPANPDWVKEVIATHRLPSEYLLSVGTIEPRKNLKNIIAALALLPPSKRLPLVIVGKGAGAYRQAVEALVEQENLTKYIIWLDRLLDNSHLQAIYTGAQMLIYPSYYEGFGLPIAEAALCRTPVVAADTSSLREAGGEHSLYVDPDSPQAISGAILRILEERETRNFMQEAGHSYAMQKFEKSYVTERVFDIYKEL